MSYQAQSKKVVFDYRDKLSSLRLVGCLGDHDPLYFSLYRAVSHREEERKQMILGRKKCYNRSNFIQRPWFETRPFHSTRGLFWKILGRPTFDWFTYLGTLLYRGMTTSFFRNTNALLDCQKKCAGWLVSVISGVLLQRLNSLLKTNKLDKYNDT